MPLDTALPAVDIRADFWSLRFVEETSAAYAVRKNVPLPFSVATDRGVMASVYVDGGYGYAATSAVDRPACDHPLVAGTGRIVRPDHEPSRQDRRRALRTWTHVVTRRVALAVE